MKKVFYSLAGLTIILSLCLQVSAQEKSPKDNSEEIIIRKKGGDDKKITIEMNGKDILINGKPVSEFKEEGVTVRTLRNKEGNMSGENSFLFTPRAGSRNFNIWTDSSFNKKHTFLGITSEQVDNGVKVTEVVEGSAAEKAGLKEGDLITSIGDKKISSPDDIVATIKNYKPTDEVKIQYQRNGKAQQAKATLGENSSMTRSFSFSNGDGDNNFFQPFKQSAPNSANSMFKLLYSGNHKLGIRIEDIEDGDGVKITAVEEGSVGEKTGLKKDDMILEVDGNKVKDVNAMRAKLREVNDKNAYKLKIKRNGAEISMDVKIPKPKNQADL